MKEKTKHYLFIGDCTKAEKIFDLTAIDLLVTSPPYFNAPFDYDELFQNYETFLEMIKNFGKFYFQALKPEAIFALNIDDMLVKGIKYPIISDSIKIFSDIGYVLKGRIVWRKPEGYIRISRRSGVLLQNPYPMYFYPDNLLESILVFQKPPLKNHTSDDISFDQDIWEITNVLPLKGRLEADIAAFPDELPAKLIKAFTKEGSWICDPFLGSGTTMKVARRMHCHSIGVELLEKLVPIIRKKVGFSTHDLNHYLDSDQLFVENLQVLKRSAKLKDDTSSYSLLYHVLKSEKMPENNFKFHLLVLDFRKNEKTSLRSNLSKAICQLFPGRVVVAFFDPLSKKGNNITLNQITDYFLLHGLRLRDKITIQHQPQGHWDVKTQYGSKVVFHHCYYEVLIFQKGKFNYKSKTEKEKQACLIDKEQFQREKWYLTLWDFRKHPRSVCDPIVITRILELFLYNEEVVYSNIKRMTCPKRTFNLKYLALS